MFAIVAAIVALLFFYIGAPFGYAGAIALTGGESLGVLAMAVAALIVGAMAVGLAIVGGIALAFRVTRPVGKILFVAAASVVTGAVVAAAAVPVLGLRYEPPVMPSIPPPIHTTTNGTVSLTFADEPEFVAGSERWACTWFIDGGALSGIIALDAGTLRGRKLGASVAPESGLEAGTIVFTIEYDGVDDLGLPTWTGTVPMTSTDSGHAGAIDFANLPIGAQKPEYPPDAAWPRTLTGTLSWTCD